MLCAEVGDTRFWLTSHLESKGTNELDLFISDAKNNPRTITADKLAAEIAIGDTKNQATFEPAPAEERPKGEKGNSCSHFVAKAAFMKATDTLTATISVPVAGKTQSVTFSGFDVKKYAHHEQ